MERNSKDIVNKVMTTYMFNYSTFTYNPVELRNFLFKCQDKINEAKLHFELIFDDIMIKCYTDAQQLLLDEFEKMSQKYYNLELKSVINKK